MNLKERLRNCHRLRDERDIGINIMCDSEQYPFAFIKDMGISGKTCVSDCSSVSVLLLS